MVRIAGTLMVAVALNLAACSKATHEGGAASDLASPAGLTNMLTTKLGISEAQASAGLGALLGEAKGKLSPGDYNKLEGVLPGAEHYLSAAEGAGVLASTKEVAAAAPAGPSPGGVSDSTVAAIGDSAAGYAPPDSQVEKATTAAGAATGASGLGAALSKVGLPPEAASQFVPVVTEYVGKVAGPDVANILKSAFPA